MSRQKSVSNAKDDSTKNWTIRKIDETTISKTKKAANLSGMKIGAWVDSQLKIAAEKTLNSEGQKSSEEISRILRKIDEHFESNEDFTLSANNDHKISFDEKADMNDIYSHFFRQFEEVTTAIKNQQKMLLSISEAISANIKKEEV